MHFSGLIPSFRLRWPSVRAFRRRVPGLCSAQFQQVPPSPAEGGPVSSGADGAWTASRSPGTMKALPSPLTTCRRLLLAASALVVAGRRLVAHEIDRSWPARVIVQAQVSGVADDPRGGLLWPRFPGKRIARSMALPHRSFGGWRCACQCGLRLMTFAAHPRAAQGYAR